MATQEVKKERDVSEAELKKQMDTIREHMHRAEQMLALPAALPIALTAFEKVASEIKALPKPRNDLLSVVYQRMGAAYAEMKQLEKSVEHFELARVSMRADKSEWTAKEHLDMRRVCFTLHEHYKKMNKPDNAIAMGRMAIEHTERAEAAAAASERSQRHEEASVLIGTMAFSLADVYMLKDMKKEAMKLWALCVTKLTPFKNTPSGVVLADCHYNLGQLKRGMDSETPMLSPLPEAPGVYVANPSLSATANAAQTSVAANAAGAEATAAAAGAGGTAGAGPAAASKSTIRKSALLDEALEHFAAALKIRRRRYEETHPLVQVLLCEMGFTHHLRRDYVQSESMLKAAMAFRLKQPDDQRNPTHDILIYQALTEASTALGNRVMAGLYERKMHEMIGAAVRAAAGPAGKKDTALQASNSTEAASGVVSAAAPAAAPAAVSPPATAPAAVSAAVSAPADPTASAAPASTESPACSSKQSDPDGAVSVAAVPDGSAEGTSVAAAS